MRGQLDSKLPEFDDERLEELLGVVKRRSRRLRSRRRLTSLVAAGVAVALVAAFAGGLGVTHATRSPGRVMEGSAQRATAPHWRLVGDVGVGWHAITTPANEKGFFLTCPVVGTCYAEGATPAGSSQGSTVVDVTTDGGSTWTQGALPADVESGSPITCVDGSTCAFLGMDSSGNAVFLETSDGGNNWTSVAGPEQLTDASEIAGASCTSAASCLALASVSADGSSYAFQTADGGATWSDSELPAGFVPIGLECIGTASCTSTGFEEPPAGSDAGPVGAAIYSTDGGASWHAAALPDGTGPVNAMACDPSSDCVATYVSGDSSSQSAVLTSTDAGRSWTDAGATGLPSSFVSDVACPSSSECVVAGLMTVTTGNATAVADAQGLIATTSDEGQSWHSQPLPDGVGPVERISCADSADCYALAFQPSASGRGSFVLLSDGP
ncbi:MAG TPA: hypothetical protein VGH10_07210 [Actinomycetota bacterium]